MTYIKKIYLFILPALFAINAMGQDLNTMFVKKKFKSEDELVKDHPKLVKTKVVIEKGTIKVMDNKNQMMNHVTRSSTLTGLNSFIFSPDGEYFVAYFEGETGIDELYFYQANGVLLNKQKARMIPTVRFSPNGEYVIVFNGFGREVFVFSKKGSLIFSGDYIEMINDKSRPLDNVLVSDDGKEILINAGDRIYYFDMKTRNKIFTADIGGWVVDGNCYSVNGKVALEVSAPTSRTWDFQVLSKASGQRLDHLTNVKEVDFLSTGVIITNDKDILEYAFKK